VEINGVCRRGRGGDGGSGAMPHLARCSPISPRPAAAGHAGEVLCGCELVFSAAAASLVGGSSLTAAPLQAISATCAGVRHRPCWRASLQVRGPPALQVSFAAGGGSAAGPVGELRRERGVCRRPCRQAPPRARGPLSALQASSGVGAMSAAVTLSPASSPPSLHYGKRPKFAFPTMHLVQCLLHCLSLAILICGLLNTRELHYTSLDSQYAAYQTPVHD
jgi:hypothetical protein